jgi:hypothetical protein
MKKMLMLMLILGAASITSALTLQQDSQSGVLSLSYDGTYLKIVSNADITSNDIYFSLAITNNAGASISNLGTLHVAQNLAADYSVFTEESATLADLDPAPPNTNGVFGPIMTVAAAIPTGDLIWNISSSGLANGTQIALQKFNEDWDGYDATYYTGTFIPEPITMALLGLGGLFLRRRK